MTNPYKFALIASFFCLNIHAEELCYIDHVEKFDGGIRVIFVKEMHPEVRGIKRSGSQVVEPFKANLPLVLKEGDESGVHGGPHEACILKAEKRENKLGILASVNYHIPGVPEQNQSKFILP